MKNKNIFVLVCLILFFICCNNNISIDGIYISEHLCELADDRYGADYVGLLETSLNGENDSIRKFVQLSFDAAYAYEHGIIIVELIERIGSEKFICALENTDSAERNELSAYIQVGLEYGKTNECERRNVKRVLQFLEK